MGRELTEAIVDGILGGGVYALMAVGLTLIFGVLDIINIAQGILVVLGAYLSYVLSVHLHLDLFVGLLVTVPAMFLVGIAIQWAFIRPLRGRERTSMSLLATYAVAIIIEGVLYLIFGSNFVSLNASYVQSGPKVFGFYLDYIYIYGFALAVLLVVAIYFMLYRTQFGLTASTAGPERVAGSTWRNWLFCHWKMNADPCALVFSPSALKAAALAFSPSESNFTVPCTVCRVTPLCR